MHAFNDGAVSENIHNPHRRDLGISWGQGGGSGGLRDQI